MPENAGLLESAKHFLATLAGVVATRLELLANELEEERLRLAQMFLLALFAVFSFCMGVLLLVLFLVVLFWDEHRLSVLAILGLAFFTGGTFLAMKLQSKLQQGSKLFSVSLAELTKDRESLEERHE